MFTKQCLQYVSMNYGSSTGRKHINQLRIKIIKIILNHIKFVEALKHYNFGLFRSCAEYTEETHRNKW